MWTIYSCMLWSRYKSEWHVFVKLLSFSSRYTRKCGLNGRYSKPPPPSYVFHATDEWLTTWKMYYLDLRRILQHSSLQLMTVKLLTRCPHRVLTSYADYFPCMPVVLIHIVLLLANASNTFMSNFVNPLLSDKKLPLLLLIITKVILLFNYSLIVIFIHYDIRF